MSEATKGLIEQVKETLGGKAAEFQLESPSRLYVAVARDDAREAVEGLFHNLGARLITISSVDTRPGIELLYHLAFDRAGLVCTVRTIVPKPSPEIESVTPAIPGAEWVEREIHELMGVDFLNHPNLAPLILADDWPKGSYPLRRSDG
jgi:NADH-quinone oxidoreductase subunit C